MLQFFKDVKIDWLANRRLFIVVSVALMLLGLGSAIFRQAVHPHGTEAFNLGVDFKGGTVITAKFKQRPTAEAIHAALDKQGVHDAVVQPTTDKTDEVLIKIPLEGPSQTTDEASKAQVDAGRTKVEAALNSFGAETQQGQELAADPQAATARRLEQLAGGRFLRQRYHRRL